MTRLRANFLTGATTDNPLTSAGTSFNSAALSQMQVITAPNYMAVSLDPFAVNGAPEIVWVTDHASGATVATILRHQESTLARAHPAGTEWANALTAQDFNELYASVENYLPLSGGTLTGLLALSGPPTADLHAATKAYVDAIDLDWANITNKPAAYPSATKLATARTIDLTGDVTATAVAFDGTANIALATVVGNDTHTHDTRYYTEGEVTSLLAGKANTHSHPYAASSHSHGYLPTAGGTVTGNLYVAALHPNIIYPNAEWPYGGASNGSLRYLGVGTAIYQNNGSSSLEEKVYVQPIDLDKSLFNHLDPIWFHYSKNHSFKELFNPDDWEREINPQATGRMGFAYEQMLEIAPQWTYETAEGMACIGYDAMVPDFMAYATAAIRDLRSRVAALEGI